MSISPTAVLARSLYLYENVSMQATVVTARALYAYENLSVPVFSVVARALYAYENLSMQDQAILARALYLYEATSDGEVFPWLMKIDPAEQYRGGQVDLYGDGFGSILEVGASSTPAASSTNGLNVPANALDRATATEWVSNDGAGAWIRLTFGAPQTIVALALVDRAASSSWGVPLFRFSDAGADVNGGVAPVVPSLKRISPEYPVSERSLYQLATPRTCSWVEVRVASGGSGSTRGLAELYVYADRDVAAEDSHTFLNADEMGVAAWLNRSPGLYPANSGLPIQPAATVTVPLTGQSGLVRVVENS